MVLINNLNKITYNKVIKENLIEIYVNVDQNNDFFINYQHFIN